jgi:predicted Mrr-cat superfamily restriction endonuclease
MLLGEQHILVITFTLYSMEAAMALADPQTLTVNTVAKTLNRVKSDGYRSEYATDDEEYKMIVSHQELKNRTRRMVRVNQRVVAADPLTSVNEYKDLGVYLVVDEPEYGFSDTNIDYVVQALCDWLTSAQVAKVLSQQH